MYNSLTQTQNIATNYQEGEKKQFLKFYLEPATKAMLPLAEVTEVLKVPLGKIVPIPQMPPWTMGIYNWRGEILWTIDLGHLLGISTWYQQQKNTINYSIVVISSRNQGRSAVNLGLIVTQVEDIEWCNIHEIKSSVNSNISSELAPFLEGYFISVDEQMTLILNGNNIIDNMPQKIN